MKTCYLEIRGERIDRYMVKDTGHYHLNSGDEYEVRQIGNRLRSRQPGWRRVRVGKILDHLTGATNRASAVYEAELLRDYPPPETTGKLFG